MSSVNVEISVRNLEQKGQNTAKSRNSTVKGLWHNVIVYCKFQLATVDFIEV